MLLLAKGNRWLGGSRLVLDYVASLAPAGPFTILDLGTGSADIPRAIVSWAREAKRQVSVTAVDSNPEMIRLARQGCEGCREITIEQRDIRQLPFADNSFDLVLCSQALHHFSVADAVSVLSEVGRIARVGYAVSDLRRNRAAIMLTNIISCLLISHAPLRHDARLSARAAFTETELCEMAERAGLTKFAIRRHHGVFKMVLSGRT
jgi:SAM-dependent methyltransferase